MAKTQTVQLPLSVIVPDENQPRKIFEPSRLKSLGDSVKRFGVMSPITVEKIGEKYLIVDGERRYRVAKELNLKELPAVIIEPQKGADRLVQQFHIQEQHEEWSPTEKAITVSKLAKELGLNLAQICDLLSIDTRTTARYMAFADIIDQKNFHRNEIGVHWAEGINSLKRLAKKLTQTVLEKEFDRNDEKDLEYALIERIKNGQLRNNTSISRIKDIFSKNPEQIKEFIDGQMSVDAMYIKSKAKGATALRRLVTYGRYAAGNAGVYLSNMDVKPTLEQFNYIKQIKKAITKVIDEIGEVVEKVEG